MTLNIPDSNDKQQYDVIADLIQIKFFLKKILDSGTLLSITIPGDNEVYDCMMNSIDNDSHQIKIDPLHPKHGHSQLLQKKKLTVYAVIEDINLSFVSVLADVNEQPDIASCTLSFPQQIKYYQKRSSYRVQIIRSLSTSVKLTCESGEIIEGELDNISPEGMRIRFTDNLPNTMKCGLSVPKCEFELPDGGHILCSVELRHIVHGENGNMSYVGIRFESLPPPDQRSVNRFATSIERRLRRRTST